MPRAAGTMIWRMLRATRGAVRDGPDRMRHASRRSAVVRDLSVRRISSVLFVCHGNICRSPFAERIFALMHKPVGSVCAASAGFIGPHRPSPEFAVGAALGFGVDLADHRSQLLSRELVGAADLVVVMNAEQALQVIRRFGARTGHVVILGDFDPLPIDRREILDPVERDLAVFERVYERIGRCVSALSDAVVVGARR